MRLALACVLAWFGLHELHAPSEWSVFVPSFIVHHAPSQVSNLVVLHGFLLALAAASVLLGLMYVAGTLLATGILCSVILELWLDGGVSDTLIRDVGVLGLGLALLFDPVRIWHLDDVITNSIRNWKRPSGRKRRETDTEASRRALAGMRAGSAIAVTLAVVGVAAILRTTGTSGAGPLDASAVLPQDAPSATQQIAVQATPRSATPSPAVTLEPAAATPTPIPTATSNVTDVLFSSWRYRDKSFQIYPGPIAPETQQALAGFALSVDDQGAQVVVNLKALSSRYHDASIPVDKANTAYFVETSMHDDPNDQENNLDDDGVVVVNPEGYLVQ